jgi:hypothetical protein
MRRMANEQDGSGQGSGAPGSDDITKDTTVGRIPYTPGASSKFLNPSQSDRSVLVGTKKKMLSCYVMAPEQRGGEQGQ